MSRFCGADDDHCACGVGQHTILDAWRQALQSMIYACPVSRAIPAFCSLLDRFISQLLLVEEGKGGIQVAYRRRLSFGCLPTPAAISCDPVVSKPAPEMRIPRHCAADLDSSTQIIQTCCPKAWSEGGRYRQCHFLVFQILAYCQTLFLLEAPLQTQIYRRLPP